MTDVFKRLADKLDGLPQGFPPTDSGVELKILRKIYAPEDAEMALNINPFPETAETIAERLNRPVEDVRGILDDMAHKGQIGCLKFSGEQSYMLSPFVPGIYEFQVYRMDKELTGLFEEYFPFLIKSTGGYEPGILRTVPINAMIEDSAKIEPYENVRSIIEKAKSFKVLDCTCRKERAIEGHACDHTLENCLGFSMEENAYDYFLLGGRIITKEEAIKILDEAAAEGLVHNALYNLKEGHAAICNCCPCCCGMMRGIKEFHAPGTMAKSNFIAVIDPDTCSECGVCAEERCPMEAISEDDDGYKVLSDVCIGCGVCTVTCPTESITLVRKPESEQSKPPDNMMAWAISRTENRIKI